MSFSTIVGRLLPGLLLLTLAGHAQTVVDATFQPQHIYHPAGGSTARQFINGTRLLAGSFIRTSDGVAVPHVARLLTDGTLDAAFNANIAGNVWSPSIIEEFPDGKILVGGSGSVMTIDGQTRNGLARLNADGTLDETYKASVVTNGYLDGLFIQPDGKVVFSGNFTELNGKAAHHLARLNADGTVDEAFGAAVGFDKEVAAVARQADGKILAGGYFTTFNATAHKALVRLNADGTLDPSFDLAVVGDNNAVTSLALQADGKVLVSGYLQPTSTQAISFTRLLTSGAPDLSFVADGEFSISNTYTTSSIQVQPDQKILVVTSFNNYQKPGIGGLIRLNADGTLDDSFKNNGFSSTQLPYSVQVLPQGQVLVAGPPSYFAGRTAALTGLTVLNADGSFNPAIKPVLQSNGVVWSFAAQADGKVVLGGAFTEVNGVAVSNLVRLNADGTLDEAYSVKARTIGGTVSKVLVQPDGKIVAAGGFSMVSGASHAGIVRLLTTGEAEAAFAPVLPLAALAKGPYVAYMGLQPGGQIIVGGTSLAGGLQRITAAGQSDATFALDAALWVRALLVQADGRIVLGYYPASNNKYQVKRLLSDGKDDASFAPVAINGRDVMGIQELADGRLLLAGNFSKIGSVATNSVARLLANGEPDASFVSGIPSAGLIPPAVRTFAVQPNQRILFATTSSAYPSGRLLPNGSLDATYNAGKGPDSDILDLAVQADGKLLVGGSFTRVGGAALSTFIRLTDANVLKVGPQQATARLKAYPNPVHDALTLVLDAAAHPSRLSLTDLRGHTVREQAVTAAEQQLIVRGLAAGVYLLRVSYAAGPVTRRIVVE